MNAGVGVVGVNSGIVIAGDSIDVEIDRVRAALEGLDPQAITKQIQDQLGGAVASRIPDQEKIIGVRVRAPGDLRTRIAQLQELTVQAPDGHYLPLQRVARVDITTGQPQITRENGRLMVAVTARIAGRSLGSGPRRGVYPGAGRPRGLFGLGPVVRILLRHARAGARRALAVGPHQDEMFVVDAAETGLEEVDQRELHETQLQTFDLHGAMISSGRLGLPLHRDRRTDWRG